jgi:ABC-2 type transport system ATP-binding protein
MSDGPHGAGTPIVEAAGLVKRYGDFTAVDGVSFQIAEGSIFGLLGPNGAGKTTTISMLACLIAPDEGDVVVDGHSVRSDSRGVRRVLGVVPQENALYPTLTAAENLRFWGKMYGLSGKQLSEAVEYGLMMAGLEDRAKSRVETFSGGMKRRINIAAGILHRPRVLLMDEPTVGIDPQSRNHILDTVRELNKEGMTVLYTSHYMEEVEALCDAIAIVDHGKVIAAGTQAELRALVGDEDRIRVKVGAGIDDAAAAAATDADAPEGEAALESDLIEEAHAQLAAETVAALERVRALPGVTRAETVGGAIDVLAPDAAAVLGEVVSAIVQSGAHIRAIEIVEPDLESVFLHLTGRGLRD